MSWVYILKGKRYYVGSTPTLIRRLRDHRRGNTHTTKRIGKWKLVNAIYCHTLTKARNLEKKIKSSKNTQRWVNDDIFEIE